MDYRATFTVRLPPEVLASVDERATANRMSRNAWLEKAIRWALEQPTRIRQVEERL